MTDIDPRRLREALSAYATGVAVVTARAANGDPVAMTINSFTAVSLQPPLVLWCVQRGVGPCAAFEAAEHYAVHVLHGGQEALANHFAQDIAEKFTGLSYDSGIGRLPLLDDFTARFQCRVERRVDGGDHVILLGRVLALDHRPAAPLIFHGGGYLR
jgi:flavin reductase (DIM6/NTAB) family NADH-FMN oxidoreductase RutF